MSLPGALICEIKRLDFWVLEEYLISSTTLQASDLVLLFLTNFNQLLQSLIHVRCTVCKTASAFGLAAKCGREKKSLCSRGVHKRPVGLKSKNACRSHAGQVGRQGSGNRLVCDDFPKQTSCAQIPRRRVKWNKSSNYYSQKRNPDHLQQPAFHSHVGIALTKEKKYRDCQPRGKMAKKDRTWVPGNNQEMKAGSFTHWTAHLGTLCLLALNAKCAFITLLFLINVAPLCRLRGRCLPVIGIAKAPARLRIYLQIFQGTRNQMLGGRKHSCVSMKTTQIGHM